jgi:hypothetical protein
MKHIPSLIGVIVLFGIVYFLTEATLTTLQLVFGIAGAVLVYSAIMAWHIRNLLGWVPASHLRLIVFRDISTKVMMYCITTTPQKSTRDRIWSRQSL